MRGIVLYLLILVIWLGAFAYSWGAGFESEQATNVLRAVAFVPVTAVIAYRLGVRDGREEPGKTPRKD